LGIVAENFPLEGAGVFETIYWKVHSTSAADCTWLAFVPLCRRCDFFREQSVFHICTTSVQISPK